MPTYRLDLGYDGSCFHGYARQNDVRTVQGDLEDALATILGYGIRTEVAGRTDAGVHARHQVVSFEGPDGLECRKVARSLGRMLAPEIVVIRCTETAPDFSARFSALERRYRYSVLNSPIPDPLRRSITWHVADPLDIDRMREAAGHFEGEHDFASFCRKAEGRSTIRTVHAAGWCEKPDDLLQFDIRGAAFCHQMVRSLVAYCVEVGRGRIEPDDTPDVLAARDRHAARGAAPACGLLLWEIVYDTTE